MRIQSLSGRRLLSLFSASALVAAISVAGLPAGAAAAAPPGAYVNGFENAEDVGATDQAMFNVSQVATGPGAITSASGTNHALAVTGSGAFTRYGGYSSTFPVGGYTTSADIYLDTSLSTSGADLRFDWDSAISDASGAFGRDFVFNVGTDGSGGFVMSGSNNAGRSGADPANPGRNPITISTSGWYTFQHRFYANGGVLSADLTVRAFGSATVLATWTLSDSTDIIGTTVGGNRYGWLVNNEMDLALDNISRSGIVVVPNCTATGFYRDGINLTARLVNPTAPVTGTVDATTCNIGVYYGPGTSGSISGASISGANYYGVVVDRAAVNITHANIHDIGETQPNGSQHGVGVLYTTFEPNPLPNTSNAVGTTFGSATGTLSGSTITAYQKNGVVIYGKGAAVKVQNNIVTGYGHIAYIAQNGIEIAIDASATVTGNTVSGNYYTPTPVTACGLLFYQAGGVKQSANVFSGNETNLCNFGRGGGNVSF